MCRCPVPTLQQRSIGFLFERKTYLGSGGYTQYQPVWPRVLQTDYSRSSTNSFRSCNRGGLAHGVDVEAHKNALDNGLDTVAVLAHGLDRIYPYTHRDAAKAIVGQGCLVTEYPCKTNPDRYNFVSRNRIIAGLSHATLIVESSEKEDL